MPREKKDYKALNIKLASPVSEKLEKFCVDSGQTKTLAVERALEAYIDSYNENQKLLKELKG